MDNFFNGNINIHPATLFFMFISLHCISSFIGHGWDKFISELEKEFPE